MAPPGALGQFHALLGSLSGTGLSAAEPAWVTGSMDPLLRFSDEMWTGQRLSLKLAACGRMGSVLVAGICFFLHICFNLIFESGIGEEYFVGCIEPKPVVGTESCQHGKKTTLSLVTAKDCVRFPNCCCLWACPHHPMRNLCILSLAEDGMEKSPWPVHCYCFCCKGLRRGYSMIWPGYKSSLFKHFCKPWAINTVIGFSVFKRNTKCTICR